MFGPKGGQILRGFLQRFDDQYEKRIYKVGGFYGSEHKLDVEAIINAAVNSYFGRHGKKWRTCIKKYRCNIIYT